MAILWKHCLVLSLGAFLVHARPKVRDYSNDVPTLYEGDMALTKEQVEALGLTQPVSKEPAWDQEAQTRGSVRNPRQLWPNGIIPFVINPRIDKKGNQLIRNSMQAWQKHVCVHFKEREQEQDYVEFVYKKGCWSYVGHIGQRQEVSIGRFTEDPPCEQGSLTHELGHALGFYHEQNRPDRDKYVKINLHNIRSGTERNFKKASEDTIDSRGVEYDYGSIMHYSKYAGNNRPGVVTIQSRDPNAELGQRKGPSKLDIKQARLMYNCDKSANGNNAYKPQTTGTGGVSNPSTGYSRPRPGVPSNPSTGYGRPRPGGASNPSTGYSRPPPGSPPGVKCIRKVKKIGSLTRITTVCRGPAGDSTRKQVQTQVLNGS
ncbi:nematocyst expressed protein 6-like isoform X3 [Oculina patagonica]